MNLVFVNIFYFLRSIDRLSFRKFFNPNICGFKNYLGWRNMFHVYLFKTFGLLESAKSIVALGYQASWFFVRLNLLKIGSDRIGLIYKDWLIIPGGFKIVSEHYTHISHLERRDSKVSVTRWKALIKFKIYSNGNLYRIFLTHRLKILWHS